MKKHTPGPWTIETRNAPIADTGDFDSVVAVIGPMRTTVVEFWNGNEVDDANAKLIAAAPDLLEALQEIVRNWDGEPEDMAAANAAIAKATR